MFGPSFQLGKFLGIPLLLSLSAGLGLSLPLAALAAPVAVLRSPENAGQWPEISDRLRTAGVNYCVLESKNWRGDGDLERVSVLLLPNVENISGLQASSLSRWMNRGGKVIVTGPTGNLSEAAIRNQLRAIFGAYWGYPNSRSYTLRPANLGGFKNQRPLATSLVGGVIIPTGVNSQTAAVWGAKENPPAVVVTTNSTFLGWRWGTNAVAPIEVDSAWIAAALQRYGIDRGPDSTGGNDCNQRSIARVTPAPLPTAPAPRRQAPPSASTRSTPPPPPTTTAVVPRTIRDRDALNPRDIQRMSEELQGLIGRYGTALLAAEAGNGGRWPIDKEKEPEAREGAKNESPDNGRRFRQSIGSARAMLNDFQQLVARGEFARAREFWLEARRGLWDSYPTDRVIAQPEIRAMWLDRGTIVKARSEEDLAKVFDRMAEAGINLVFFETVNASYTIYPSRVAPEQNPLTRGWDPLKAAVKLAHERNMEIHAWVWAFAAANQKHNEVLGQPKNYLGPVLSRNPDWGATNKSGGAFDYGRESRKAFFDPANPAVQDYLVSLYEEIVRNYDVDGVQLDYIRYPFQDPRSNQTYGYGKASRTLFQQMTGVDPITLSPGNPLWESWTAFKIQQIDSFVSLVSTRLKGIRPDLKLSVAVFPMAKQERLYRIQQHWENWGRNQWVDMIFLMTYALDTGTLEDKTELVLDRESAGSSLIIPGIRLLKVPDPVTIDQLQFIRNLPTAGFALFATENLNPNLQVLLNRTQGAITSRKGEPLPHRQPFKTAAARFQVLRQEWNFLQTNNFLAMDEGALKTWEQEVSEVAKKLDRLATDPNPANFSAAQYALSRFSDRFDRWMFSQKEVFPYQVQVWRNRLETLARLLNYGQRVELK
ncbi:family 10 glycosylhydrolase [Pannus brasiliensis CCIBt3594]|uniref:Family 10 glycosylhydrolase n=1 Tax=Pannus brasiliensis CCIBt3594 TaxID=1427578 RepID=A0AAW9QWD3_9CHRO